METYQIKVELKKAITWPQVLLWVLLVLPLPIIKFLLVKENYVYYRHIDVFLRVNSDFLPLLFPLLMILVFSPRFVGEQKNNFLTYVNSRIPLEQYFRAKLVANGIIAFIIAFLSVFIPFVFVMYIEPFFNIITIYPEDGNKLPVTTFEQFLFLGPFIYGLIYSTWVGINGILYANFGLLLLLLLEKPLVALSAPFIYYLVGNFLTQLFGYEKFSPGSTIFPFSLSQQHLWTVLVPLSVLIIILSVLFHKLRRKVKGSYE